MRSQVVIKDNKVTSTLNLPDGTYNINISKISDDKTLDQVRKLWATIGDISTNLYGNTSEKDNIYLQILKMAGQRTYQLTMEEDVLDAFIKNKSIKCLSVKSREVVHHKVYVLCEVVMTGISEMDRKEVSKVIDVACRWCDELGIIPQVER